MRARRRVVWRVEPESGCTAIGSDFALGNNNVTVVPSPGLLSILDVAGGLCGEAMHP